MLTINTADALHRKTQQIQSNFVDSFGKNYKEITKIIDLVDNIQVWVDATKTTLLFSKVFTYTVEEEVQTIITTDHLETATLTKTIGRPSESVITITEVIS